MKIKEILLNLFEARMSPAVFQKFARSPEAANTFIGIEFELYFKGILQNNQTKHWDDQVVDQLAVAFTKETGIPAKSGSSNDPIGIGSAHWIFTKDGSVTHKGNPDDMGMEIKTPAVPLPQFMKQFNTFIQWLRNHNAYTNERTGLHMNMSVQGKSIDYLKLVLFSGSDKVSADFERTANEYAQSNISKLNINSVNKSSIYNKIKQNLLQAAAAEIESASQGKYFQVNTHDDYVEFRAPGNDWLGRFYPLVENTIYRYAYALSIATDPKMEQQEYAKKLMKLFGTEEYSNKLMTKISDEPRLIKRIKNPSEQLQIVAVTQNGYSIQFIENPSEQVQLAAVQQSGYAISYIKNPSEEVQLAAVQQNAYAIYYVQNPTEQVQLAAVNQDGDAIQHIENPSEQVQLAAVQQNGDAIQYIVNPSEQLQIAAVTQNGNAIIFIENPSEQVQLAAVKQHGEAIRYIETPSEQVQLAAVQQNGWSIQYIKNPSEQVQLAAVKQTPKAYVLMKNNNIDIAPSVVEYMRNI